MRLGLIVTVAGAAGVFLRDARRRNEARDRVLSLVRRGTSTVQGSAQDAANRAKGAALQAGSQTR